MERRLCGANPLRTHLFLFQSMGESTEIQVSPTYSSLPSAAVFGVCGLPVNNFRLLKAADVNQVEIDPQHSPLPSPQVIPKRESFAIRQPIAAPSAHCL